LLITTALAWQPLPLATSLESAVEIKPSCQYSKFQPIAEQLKRDLEALPSSNTSAEFWASAYWVTHIDCSALEVLALMNIFYPAGHHEIQTRLLWMQALG
jgi:hypothetical protein